MHYSLIASGVQHPDFSVSADVTLTTEFYDEVEKLWVEGNLLEVSTDEGHKLSKLYELCEQQRAADLKEKQVSDQYHRSIANL